MCRVLVQADAEGYMELLGLDGSRMKPNRHSLAPLLQGGLSLQSISRRWSTRNKEPKGPKDPCDFFLCEEASQCDECLNDVEGRTRLGASELFGGYVVEFTEGSRQISLEIVVRLIPFFVTSKDETLFSQLQSLLPLSESQIVPSGSSSEADEDEDDGDDGDDGDDADEHGEGDEEELEDGEDDAQDTDSDEDEDQDELEGQEVNGTDRNEMAGAGDNGADNGARRRLMGKQPPPREWC